MGRHLERLFLLTTLTAATKKPSLAHVNTLRQMRRAIRMVDGRRGSRDDCVRDERCGGLATIITGLCFQLAALADRHMLDTYDARLLPRTNSDLLPHLR